MADLLALADQYEQQRRETCVIDALHARQRELVHSMAKRRAAVCGRRAGKTEATAAWLLQGGYDSPGELSVYIALSRPHARMILWATLQRIERRHKLGLWLHEVDRQLVVDLPNEHRIWLAGCKDRSGVEKFRGTKYRRAAIDEAGSFGPYLEDLVEDVLEPALMDLDGEVMLVGSPCVVPAGYFYETTTGDGRPQWDTYHWTVLDNPYMPHAAKWLERKRKANGWALDHPRFRREYMGLWVLDLGALPFPFDSSLNACAELPEGRYHSVIGIDLGYESSTAWVVLQWRERHPEYYIVECETQDQLIPSRVAARTEYWLQRYPNAPIVVDTGGLGVGYAEEMRQTYQLPVIAAEKQHKASAIEMMRGDLLSGQVKVHPRCRQLTDEWQRAQWNEKHTDVDDRCPNHLSDAALYAHRHARPWYRPEQVPPTVGTPEWWAEEQRKIREQAQRAVLEKRRFRERTERKRIERALRVRRPAIKWR